MTDTDTQNEDAEVALYQALVIAAADHMLKVPAEAQRGTRQIDAIGQYLDETLPVVLVHELRVSLDKLGWRICSKKEACTHTT